MSIASTMNTTLNIETETQTKSAAGLLSRSWTTRTADVPARVQDMDAKTVIEYARLGYDCNATAFFASDPELKGNEATSRLVVDGAAFYVVLVQNQGGRINKLWKVVCNKKPLAYSTTG